MMVDYVMLVVGVLAVVVMVYIAVKEFSSLRTPRVRPEVQTGYKPSLKATMPDKAGFQVSLKGKGDYASEPLYLQSALYRIVYQFPQDIKLSVDLASTDGKHHKSLILNKLGYGSLTFNVQISKYYVLHVRASQDDANWTLVLNGL